MILDQSTGSAVIAVYSRSPSLSTLSSFEIVTGSPDRHR
jgi:hypothetical protein